MTDTPRIQVGTKLYRVYWLVDNPEPQVAEIEVAEVHPGGCGYYLVDGSFPCYGYEYERHTDGKIYRLIHTQIYLSPREALEGELRMIEPGIPWQQRRLVEAEAKLASLQRKLDDMGL